MSKWMIPEEQPSELTFGLYTCLHTSAPNIHTQHKEIEAITFVLKPENEFHLLSAVKLKFVV